MKSLREYVQEQLDDNNNVLITEGKFWNWLKSLFKGKNKKYKKDYDEWVNSDNSNKKFDEQITKLNNEYNKKSTEIINKINDSSTDDDIKKISKELSDLTDKRTEVINKLINNSNLGEIKKGHGAVSAAIQINLASQLIVIIKKFSAICKSRISAEDLDNDIKEKEIKTTITQIKNNIEVFVKNTYNGEFTTDETKQAVINVFKDCGADKYLDISDNDIKLNEKNYIEILKKSAKKENK